MPTMSFSRYFSGGAHQKDLFYIQIENRLRFGSSTRELRVNIIARESKSNLNRNF